MEGSRESTVNELRAEVFRLGHFPRRKRKPANSHELSEDKLAKKVRARWNEFSAETQDELRSLQDIDGQTLFEVRLLGRWPPRKYSA